jgi:hypothetical protein
MSEAFEVFGAGYDLPYMLTYELRLEIRRFSKGAICYSMSLI